MGSAGKANTFMIKYIPGYFWSHDKPLVTINKQMYEDFKISMESQVFSIACLACNLIQEIDSEYEIGHLTSPNSLDNVTIPLFIVCDKKYQVQLMLSTFSIYFTNQG